MGAAQSSTNPPSLSLVSIHTNISSRRILIAPDHYDKHIEETLIGDRSSTDTAVASVYSGDILWTPGHIETSVAIRDLSAAADNHLWVKINCTDETLSHGRTVVLHIWHETDAVDAKPFMISKPVVSQVGENIFHFDMPGHPCGLQGPFRLALQLQEAGYAGTCVFKDRPNFEVYYINPKQLPRYFKDGVHLLLLRMFLLPFQQNARPDAKFNMAQWVAMVTQIVHGSKEPFTGKDKKTADHWLKYESVDGHRAFAQNHGGEFSMTAWLDAYRNWDQSDGDLIQHINCYDQAGATEIALSLGLRYQQITWEYHQIFGFIKSEAELVGWGKCNNPYFGHNTKRMIVDSDDKNRWPFRNHAFLSWCKDGDIDDKFYANYNERMKQLKESKNATHEQFIDLSLELEADSNKELLMIDSCAGPHVGTERRDVYWKGVEAIHEPFKDHPNHNVQGYAKRDAEDKDEQHYLGHGVDEFDDDVGKVVPSRFSEDFQAEKSNINDFLNKSFYQNLVETQFALPQIAKDMLARQLSGLQSAPLHTPDAVVCSQYAILVEAFELAVKRFHPDWTGWKNILVREHHVKTTTINERKLQYATATQVQGYCSMKVMVSASPDVARDQFLTALASHKLTSLDHPVKETLTRAWKINDVKILSIGSLRAFLYRNLAVFISGPGLWAKEVDECLALYLSRVAATKIAISPDQRDWEKFWNKSQFGGHNELVALLDEVAKAAAPE